MSMRALFFGLYTNFATILANVEIKAKCNKVK